MLILLDENVHAGVTAALVARGVDAVRVLDTVLAGAPDVVVLEWASRQGRVIVTRDYRDFSHLARAWQRLGRSFPGVLRISPALRHDDVGGIAARIERFVHGAGALAPGTVGWVRVGGEAWQEA